MKEMNRNDAEMVTRLVTINDWFLRPVLLWNGYDHFKFYANTFLKSFLSLVNVKND